MQNKRNVKQKMKKTRKRKLRFGRIFFLLFIIFLLVYSFFYAQSRKSQDYLAIASRKNTNYPGIGQEIVSGKDGYTTTFTTYGENTKVYKEYKQNGQASWAELPYWSGTMSDNGCGITCLSILLSGYGKDYTPEDLRQKYSPRLDGKKIPEELRNTFGIDCSDFYFATPYFSKSYLIEHLQKNLPVLICVWTENGANRWTTTSHYLVLLATDGIDQVYISNPNGEDNTPKASGWYSFDEITPFIAKALFIESDP